MKKKMLLLISVCFACCSAVLFSAPAVFATAEGPHATISCLECHASEPAAGRPVDFVTGDKLSVCGKCHGSSSSTVAAAPLSMTLAAANVVNRHASSGMIPDAMKPWINQWLTDNGYPIWGDPSTSWSYGCSTCHKMHGAPYPALLIYNMQHGELCNLCHGGTANTATDWTLESARRVLYGPAHTGLVQADGVTEVPVPQFPSNGDVVSSTVNFPLAAFSGFHRSTADIAYKIGIPGSVFNAREVNPADHMSWYLGAGMVTWDTTLEANGPYTITITPSTPSTLVDANPVSLTVVVNNQTLADRICTLADKVRSAGVLNQGVENSLISKATNACKSAQQGNWNAAAGILGAFKNAVAAQSGKFVPAASATMLITFTDSLLTQIPQ